MWTCIDFITDIDGLTGEKKKDILFWSLDSITRKVHEVRVPKGCMPVAKIGRA